MLLQVEIGDSVTRVTIFGDSDSTRVTLRKMVTRLESRFSQNDSTRDTDNDSIQSHFYKISEFLIDKPTSCELKDMSIFCFSDDQDWRKFSVLPVLVRKVYTGQKSIYCKCNISFRF